MNCCACYEGSGRGRMSAGEENAGLAVGQHQLNPEGLSSMGIAAAWAGGSHTPLAHWSKSTNPVSLMSSVS